MADTKQILIVDDRFEMLELIRSTLELTGRSYDVIAVPSGEEGWLELRRRQFALLITDMRLPGMSGLDLIRRARNIQGALPIIVITGYGSEQIKQEAFDLGVLNYFEKPLVDTSELLLAAQTAMGETVQPAGGRGAGTLVIDDTLARVGERLSMLRNETGALQILLIDGQGNILFEEGQDCGLDLGRLATTLSVNLNNSNFIAEHLGSDETSTIQYFAGAAVDLYVANIGVDYFVMVLFEGLSRRGRIGTVWVFLQRAANDLLNLMQQAKSASEQVSASATPLTAPLTGRSLPAADPAEQVVTGPLDDKFVPTAILDEADLHEMEALAEDESPLLPDLSAFPLNEAAFDFDLGEALATDVGDEADDFWQDVLKKTETGPLGQGFTLEEAREQGLFPADYDESEEG